ncbi:MAG: lipid-A-disaccharide synthase [Bernardetiaceae bacterium]|jgi:lipid-A-disaccharide synthase|nr:lipid-A-disaccharide synthase [Bernardetiaceae bacterium]
MRYYLIAGEKSGDLHGGNLVRALRTHDPAGQFRAWGGDEMQAAGAELDQHIRHTAFMGIVEVIKHLPKILGFLRTCREQVAAFAPDVLILIDYAGFNLRMAAWAKKRGIRVFYYISPKIWAWRQSRGWRIKATVDRMFVIMPFEREFYQRFGYAVDYVGNPLLDAVKQFTPQPDFKATHGLDERPLVALLPGSRRQEVRSMLPTMTQLPAYFSDYQWIMAGVNTLSASEYAPAEAAGIKVIVGQTYNLLALARAAVVNSGTATLETALFQVPQVVAYQAHWLTALAARWVLKIPYVSLANLVAGQAIVPELLQGEFNPANLRAHLAAILAGPAREAQLAHYQGLRQQMDTGQSASALAAQLMWQYLQASGKISY